MPSWGSIGAGLANVYPGVLAGRKGEADALLAEMNAQQAQESQQADVLRGNALMELFKGGAGGQTPPMPGQSSQPMGPPQGGVPSPGGAPGAPFPPMAGPRPSPAPPAPMGPMASQPAPVTAPQAVPRPFNPAQPPTPTGGGGQNDPATGQPVAGVELNGVGEQNGKPTIHGGTPNGPLTWQAIGQAIARSNPGAPPQLIAKAIDRFAPMMTQESQLQWRMLKFQQDEKLLGVKEEGKTNRQQTREQGLNTRQGFMIGMREKELAGKNTRAEVSNETRMAAAALSADTRKLIADAHESGADARLLTTLRARDDWKKLDVESKREITEMILEGQREREATRQEGADARNKNTVAGADRRNAAIVAGAAARNQNTTETALKISRERNDFAKWLADGKPITATQSRISEKGQTYDSAIGTIDEALQDVARGHREGKDVVGLKGKVLGIRELAGNIGGWNDETRRAAFEQKIATLQNTIPRLLTGSSITNKDERARMGQILQGLSPGSTKQATVHDLVWLKEKLAGLKPALGANTNQGDIRATRPAAPTLAPMNDAAKAARDAAIADGHPAAAVEKMLRDKGFDPAQ